MSNLQRFSLQRLASVASAVSRGSVRGGSISAAEGSKDLVSHAVQSALSGLRPFRFVLFAVFLLFGFHANAQGLETFDNSAATASYLDGSFTGNDGVEWSYVHSRDEGSFPIDGAGIMLRRSNEPSSLSATLSGGLGSISVDTRKAFSGNAQRRLELLVNGTVAGQFEPDYPAGETDTVITFTVENIDLPGNVDIRYRLFGPTGNQQMTLDNVSWTGFATADPILFASTLSVTDLTYTEGSGPSAAEAFTLSGENLDAEDVSLDLTGSDFEISLEEETGFTETLLIEGYNGEDTDIFVRLKAGLGTGSYAGQIDLSIGSEPSLSVSLSGEVTAAPPALEAFGVPYQENFAGFTEAGTLPSGWDVSDDSYGGDWGTGFSAGLRGNAEVLGYQHTGSTGIFTATLTLLNNTGQTVETLEVEYLGRAERLSEGRTPEWTVTVEGIEAGELTYSTASGDSVSVSALISGLSIADGASFEISWSSDRGSGSGSSRQIGISDVSVSAEETALSAPVLSETAGTYFEDLTVFVSNFEDYPEGTNLFFTVNGDEPTDQDAAYDDAFGILLEDGAGAAELQIVAIDADLNESPVTTALFTFPVNVADIEALRASDTGTLYRVLSEATFTGGTDFRNTKFFQDPSGFGIQIDDAPSGNFNPGVITTAYEAGDNVEELIGVLGAFQGQLQLVPAVDFGAPVSSGNEVTPLDRTLDELTSDDQSRLIRVVDVEFEDGDGENTFGGGGFVTNIDDPSTSGFEGLYRNVFGDSDITDALIPEGPVEIIGIVQENNAGLNLSARSLADISGADDPVTGPLTLVHYLNFNDTDNLLNYTFSQFGATEIDADTAPSSEITFASGQGFSGENLRFCDEPESHLRVNNPIGTVLTFPLSTAGYLNPVVKYEARRSGQGAGDQQVSYSLNGEDFIPFQTVSVFNDDPALIELDFSGVAGAGDNPDFAVRIEFEEADGGTGGNNRFDNFTLEAEPLESTEVFFPVEADVLPAATGTVSGAALSEVGSEVTVIALPEPGFVFVGWTDCDGTEVSTDAEYTFTMPNDYVGLTANFEADLPDDLVYFWFFGSDLPNNTPLPSVDAVFPPGTSADMVFEGPGNMERRNSPTTINYRPDGNGDIAFEDAGMRGIQVRLPFEDNGDENALVFNMSTAGYEDLIFSLAAIDEGAAEALLFEYSVTAGTPEWTTDGLSAEDIEQSLETDVYKLFTVSFQGIEAAENNPDFKVRMRFIPDPEASGSDRVTLNNVSLDGKIGAPSLVYYSAPEGDLDDPATWGANPDGTGPSPENFEADNTTFILANRTEADLDNDLEISGVASRLVVGTESEDVVLNVNAVLTALTDVNDGSSLVLNNAEIPVLGDLGESSTVHFAMADPITVPASPVYGNLIVSGAGTKTFEPAAYTVNGGLTLSDTEIEAAREPMNIAGDITLEGTVSYTGPERWNINTFGNGLQQVATGTNTLEAHNFYAEDKTAGGFVLAPGAQISARNNLRFDFSEDALFDDGGNTIVFGDDLEIRGGESNYIFTGTLRLEGLSGDNDFDRVDVPLNNLEIVLEGEGRARMNRSGAPLIRVKGDFLYQASASNSNMPMGSVELRIGGNFTDLSPEDRINEQNSTVVFDGDENTVINSVPVLELNNLTIEKDGADVILDGNDAITSGTLSLTSGLMRVGDNNFFAQDEITGASESSYVVTDGAGSLVRFAGDAPVSFPVGIAGYYPAEIIDNGTGADFSVKVTEGILTGGTDGDPFTADAVNRTWTVASDDAGEPDITLTLFWPETGADLLDGFDAGSCYVKKFDEGAWAADDAEAADLFNGLFSRTRTEITDLGIFGVSSADETICVAEIEISSAGVVVAPESGGGNIALCEGEDLELVLSAVIQGAGPFEISYALNGSPLPISEGVAEGELILTVSSEDLSAGNNTLEALAVIDSNGCEADAEDLSSYNLSVTVNELPEVDPGTYPVLCDDDSALELQGMPEGGTWSGTGVTGNLFDPASGTQTLTYTFTNEAGCTAAADVTVTVEVCIPGDDPCDALEVVCDVTLSGTTAGAGSDDAPFCDVSNTGAGIWHVFTPEIDGFHQVDLCGSDFDTRLSVFEGSCDDFTCVAGNENDPRPINLCGNQSVVDFFAEEGKTYYILVHGTDGAEGNYNLTVTCPCNVNGGTIAATGPVSVCPGTGEPQILDFSLTGNFGPNSIWVVTQVPGNDILASSFHGPNFDWSNFAPGQYRVFHASYGNDVDLTNVTNPSQVSGCRSVSNPVTVTCGFADGGTITTESPVEVCVGTGTPKNVTAEVSGAVGPFSAWGLVDSDNILVARRASDSNFNLDQFAPGTYRIFHATYLLPEDVSGLLGQNVASLPGCVERSNPITVSALDCGAASLSSQPNPTSGHSEVFFEIANDGDALLEVYDMQGRLLRTLYKGFAGKEITHRFDFDGSALPNGVYLYRLTTEHEVITDKFMIAR